MEGNNGDSAHLDIQAIFWDSAILDIQAIWRFHHLFHHKTRTVHYFCKKQCFMNNTVLPKHWFYLFMLAFIWGSSYILMKKGLIIFSANQLGCLRLTITMFALVPFAFQSFKKIDQKDWPALLIVGVIGSGLPAFLFAAAQVKLDSSVTGILSTTTPLSTLIIGLLFFSVPFQKLKFFGVLIGLLGAILLIIFSVPPETSNGYLYGIYVILATTCYAFSANTIKKYCGHIPSFPMTVWVFMFLGPFALAYLLSTDFVSIMQTQAGAWKALGFISILAIGGTAFASFVFFRLTQQTSPLFATSLSYLQPAVAIGWGFLDGEQISIFYLITTLLILSGVYLTSRPDSINK